MREFRKKQKRLKIAMNTICIVAAVTLFIYIGITPILSDVVDNAINVCTYLLIIAAMVVLFIYFNKYGKSDKFLEAVEYELSDDGYYLTSRTENTIEDYTKAVLDDLKKHSFSINSNVEVDDFTFDYKATKGKDVFYVINIDELDKNDIIAYQESAIYEITSMSMKRKANAVMLYVCDKADEGAISLSKMITPLGKKEYIKFANAIVELSSGRCYFLGNKPTKCQQLIINFVMNCEIPIKDKYKSNEKLLFQYELEEHMKDFNIKDFKSGNFYAH